MADLRTKIILDLQGNLERMANRFEGSLGRLSQRGSRSMMALHRTLGTVGNGLDALGNRYAALITGAAGVGAVKMVADFSQRMTQLGVDANLSADGVDKLKRSIFEISRSADIRIDPAELLSAVEEIVKATGDLPFAERNMRTMGLAIRAAAASGKDVGAMVTELQKLDKAASPKNIMLALDIFNTQGKAGAVALRDLAAVGPRVFAAYASMRKGADPATFTRELGATLQTIKGGTGSVEQAATSFEALMRTFMDAKNLQKFEKAGIKIFDPEALKQHRKELRPINELMAEIAEKTKGDPVKLDYLIPDAEAKRAMLAPNLAANLRAYYKVEADGSATTADAARNAKELNASLQSLYTAWQQFADRELSGPIRKAADALNSLDAATVDRWLKIAGIGAGVLGAAVVGRKVYQAGRGVMGLFGKGGGGEALAGAAGKAGFGDAIPVYVVNGPASIWPGANGATNDQQLVKTGSAAITAASLASPLILPSAVAVTAVASRAIAQALSEAQARTASVAQLQELRGRQMVMGGGQDSYQVRLIDRELAERQRLYSALDRPEMSGTLKIEVAAKDATVKVKQMQGKNLNLDVDSGQLLRSH